MRIYTKTGDDGTTGLFGGDRISKDALRIETYGTIDELNAVLGVARCHEMAKEFDDILDVLQNDLFCLGADLASPNPENRHVHRMDESDIARIEGMIDYVDGLLPALSNFILPGGSPLAAHLHVARNVCRRAERKAVALRREELIGKAVIVYLNRLSDLLFVLARWANVKSGRQEVQWKGKR